MDPNSALAFSLGISPTLMPAICFKTKQENPNPQAGWVLACKTEIQGQLFRPVNVKWRFQSWGFFSWYLTSFLCWLRALVYLQMFWNNNKNYLYLQYHCRDPSAHIPVRNAVTIWNVLRWLLRQKSMLGLGFFFSPSFLYVFLLIGNLGQVYFVNVSASCLSSWNCEKHM